MLPRNLRLLRFPLALRATLATLADVAQHAALKPVGPLELTSKGFVSPFGRDSDVYAHAVGDALLLTLGGESKILPSATVNEALAAKLESVRQREGRNPGGRERKRLKDEVLTDLLPRALTKPSRTVAWLDLARGWLIVDTASRTAAEDVVTVIRDALGSFPALPVNAETSPRAILTAWLAGEPMPKGFELGDACELHDPVDAGAVVKCKRQELASEEIEQHLRAGKQVFRLALVFNERLAFELGEDMAVRKLRFLETATEALDSGERDSLRAEIDATFALASGEVASLLDALTDAFSLSPAEA